MKATARDGEVYSRHDYRKRTGRAPRPISEADAYEPGRRRKSTEAWKGVLSVTARPRSTRPRVATDFEETLIAVAELTPARAVLLAVLHQAIEDIRCVASPGRGRDALDWIEDDTLGAFSLPQIALEFGLSVTKLREHARAAWRDVEVKRAARREQRRAARGDRRRTKITAKRAAADARVVELVAIQEKRLAKQRAKAARLAASTPPPASHSPRLPCTPLPSSGHVHGRRRRRGAGRATERKVA